MSDVSKLDILFRQHGFTDYKLISPEEIVVAHWVRMKCKFSCTSYGKRACCPPNTPSVPDCRQFFDEYSTIAILHFEKAVDSQEDRHSWANDVNQKLLKLERKVFLSGYHKAFLLFMAVCRFCTECTRTRAECRDPMSSRPVPEAMAVDVFSTARQAGYPIEVLTDHSQTMNRYSLLLIE